MNHQRVFVLIILAGLIAVLAACGSAAASTTTQVSGLDTSYPNALNLRGQLLVGTVRLEEGSGPAVTKEHAAKLIPLWQASSR